jgi:hypothetical protein
VERLLAQPEGGVQAVDLKNRDAVIGLYRQSASSDFGCKCACLTFNRLNITFAIDGIKVFRKFWQKRAKVFIVHSCHYSKWHEYRNTKTFYPILENKNKQDKSYNKQNISPIKLAEITD